MQNAVATAGNERFPVRAERGAVHPLLVPHLRGELLAGRRVPQFDEPLRVPFPAIADRGQVCPSISQGLAFAFAQTACDDLPVRPHGDLPGDEDEITGPDRLDERKGLAARPGSGRTNSFDCHD